MLLALFAYLEMLENIGFGRDHELCAGMNLSKTVDAQTICLIHVPRDDQTCCWKSGRSSIQIFLCILLSIDF